MSKSLVLHERVGSVFINVNFTDKVCNLTSDSGDGKSYFFNLLYLFYLDTDIKVALINYTRIKDSEEAIFSSCKDADIVLLDNADLYLTVKLVDKLLELDCMILFCARTEISRYFKGQHRYKIKFDGHTLTSRRY